MTKNAYDFNNLNPSATVIRRLDPLVIEKPRAPIHIHTYGGETRFFKGLAEGRLWGTYCDNLDCDPSGREAYIHLPPRIYCPDCLEKMEWQDITDVARETARIHTHITVLNPGAFNRVAIPCQLVSIEIEGVATVLMSQLMGAEPEIGMPVEPVFNTSNPTFTILDLAWKPR